MEFFPSISIGLWNGWLLVVIFYVIFGVMLLILPKPVVARLYDRTGQERPKLQRLVGVFFFLIWLVLTILYPLKIGTPVFYLGVSIFALGVIGMVVALINYSNTPLDEPVTAGLYKISRHPQQFTLSAAFLGVGIAIGSWVVFFMLCIGFIAAHNNILEEEQACLQQYGEEYEQYLKTVPRYFLFF
jgi:protein-S-isoprenylcysteine O-methyltransferase Ste14